MSLAYNAMEFARHAHRDQKRRYTATPYADHLAEVAGIVATVMPGPDVIAVAWLHDCIEDQATPVGTLLQMFGENVALGVLALSDLEQGNRAQRKFMSRERLARQPGWIQTIKCADLISNTSSIVQHDPKFAVTYLAEKRALLEVMTRADPRLLEMAQALYEAEVNAR